MSDYISKDLLFVILKQLPVKTILRSRCVCKSWKELIDSRSFIIDHLTFQRPRLIAVSPELKYLVVDSKTLDGVQTEGNHSAHSVIKNTRPLPSIIGTVHGVICLYDNENLLHLWNPSIRRILRLPLPEIRPVAGSSVNPNDLKCSGFWIDPKTNEFKIVIFFLAHRKIAVYSSRNQAWMEMTTKSKRVMKDSLAWSGDPQILIERVGYWQLFDHDLAEFGDIVCFDFEKDKFRTIKPPKLKEVEDMYYRNCIKWRDCVSIVHWKIYWYPFECDLWVKRKRSWSKMFSFNFFEPISAVIYMDEECDWLIAEPSEGHVVLFRPKIGDIRLRAEPPLSGYVKWACDFVESLVFPDPKSIQ